MEASGPAQWVISWRHLFKFSNKNQKRKGKEKECWRAVACCVLLRAVACRCKKKKNITCHSAILRCNLEHGHGERAHRDARRLVAAGRIASVTHANLLHNAAARGGDHADVVYNGIHPLALHVGGRCEQNDRLLRPMQLERVIIPSVHSVHHPAERQVQGTVVAVVINAGVVVSLFFGVPGSERVVVFWSERVVVFWLLMLLLLLLLCVVVVDGGTVAGQ